MEYTIRQSEIHTEVQMTKQYTKMLSMSLTIRKKQTKTTLKIHLIPVRMATDEKNNSGKDGSGYLYKLLVGM